MGKGDQRTKRGKIIVGSFGKSRPKTVHKVVIPEVKKEVKPATKKRGRPKKA